MARHSRKSEDLIRALWNRRTEKQEWKRAQLQAAAEGDWPSFRANKPRVGGGWQTHFAEANHQDPRALVHECYCNVFEAGEVPCVEEEVAPPSPDFTEEELLHALGRGKRGKSVGIDGVSLELLQGVCEQAADRMALLKWFNLLIHGGTLPEEWLQSIMILLSKTELPEVPGSSRPISMGSATEKLFSRMILERCKDRLSPGYVAVQCSPQAGH